MEEDGCMKFEGKVPFEKAKPPPSSLRSAVSLTAHGVNRQYNPQRELVLCHASWLCEGTKENNVMSPNG